MDSTDIPADLGLHWSHGYIQLPNWRFYYYIPEKQIEEKKQQELRQNNHKDESTWADKFSQHQPAPFPEQPREMGQGDKLNTSIDHVTGLLDTGRVHSAPEGDPDEQYI
jgi:hypothetical protein